MRLTFAIAAFAATAASPALAQQAAPPPPPAATPQLPPELTDPRMLDQLGNVAGVLARALLELPVGEVEAAIENRPVTAEDRRKTVASETGMNPGELEGEVERGKIAVKQGGQAMVRTLPVITRALSQAGEQINRAIANLPSPTYPRR
jgi:hypothetical protein